MYIAGAAARALLDDTSDHGAYRRALETAIVVSYWRPFSGNRGGSLGKRDAPQRADWKHIHDWLREQRDTVHAHSDEEAGRASKVVIHGVDDEGIVTAAWTESWGALPVQALPAMIEMFEAQAQRFLVEAGRIQLKPETTPRPHGESI
jgi:hypothetical protein